MRCDEQQAPASCSRRGTGVRAVLICFGRPHNLESLTGSDRRIDAKEETSHHGNQKAIALRSRCRDDEGGAEGLEEGSSPGPQSRIRRGVAKEESRSHRRSRNATEGKQIEVRRSASVHSHPRKTTPTVLFIIIIVFLDRSVRCLAKRPRRCNKVVSIGCPRGNTNWLVGIASRRKREARTKRLAG